MDVSEALFRRLDKQAQAVAAVSGTDSVDFIFGRTLGLVAASANGVVRRRTGVLAHWAPEIGQDIFDSAALFGMKDFLFLDVMERRRRLVLQDVSLNTPSGQVSVDIEVEWDAAASLLRFSTYDVSDRIAAIYPTLQARRANLISREYLAFSQSHLS